MSFINLLANDIWSEADIINRTESMIASQFSKDDVIILNRKVTAQAIGQYILTDEEQSEVIRYTQVCEDAKQAGIDARSDMALLLQVFPVEAAQRRLAQYLLEEGIPAITEERSVIGEDGLTVTETTVIVPAIEPITEYILDTDGNPTSEINPEWTRVLQDRAERADAQATIDTASEHVLSLIDQRLS